MRIKRVEITNFRCINNAVIEFDEITTFIGPNGAGKSSVLRALDWFFNGDKTKPLTQDDLYIGASEQKITVRVDFDNLSAADREVLGQKYAPDDVETFTAWRIWENGEEKITGKALAFPGFEAVRTGANASEQRERYGALIEANPEVDLPRWTNQTATLAAMDVWEREHPEQLEESEVSDTNFFGFAGQGKLSGIFDYVLVSADLRAGEESVDSRTSIIGRILEKAVDRTQANEAFSALTNELAERHEAINVEHLQPQLQSLSDALSTEVAAFASGRTVSMKPAAANYKPQAAKFEVKVVDNELMTDVEHQGHGFQRTLLISALKLLASRGSREGGSHVICLAIEEPELFQHPTQAKAFAVVLRQLAEDPASGLQVTYATHSPYFVEPRYFDQIRRVHRSIHSGDEHATVTIAHATMHKVCARLAGYEDVTAVQRRLDNACLNELREALFAQAVALVEGNGDRGVFEGTAGRTKHLSVDGIEVAAAGHKQGIFLPHAILAEIGVSCYVVFDGDMDVASRMRAAGKTAADITNQETQNKQINRKILRYLGMPEADWPSEIAGERVTIFPDTIETFLQSEWPAWEATRQSLITSGKGYAIKNAATYALAASTCTTDPGQAVLDIISQIRQLVCP